MAEQQQCLAATMNESAPPHPLRPEEQHYQSAPFASEHSVAAPATHEEQYYPPPPPIQQQAPPMAAQQEAYWPEYNPEDYADKSTEQYQVPAYNPHDYANIPIDQEHLYAADHKQNRYSGEQDITSPIHYARDPKKLVAYLIPFPKPHIPNVPPESIPPRFLIYTPPPPPFMDTPAEGEKEAKVHKAQRKWLSEIREAKTGNAKTMSWKGVKGKAIRGIDWGMGKTKSSNLEFLNRINPATEPGGKLDKHAEDGHLEGEDTAATVKLEEILLVYPSSMPGTPEQLREEFINSMLRSKSKAQRDTVIATGLLPVSFGIDVLLTVVWPFGGLLEIDAVWAYSSLRGAKASRSVTTRLTSTSKTGKHDEDMLHLNFAPSPRLAVLEQYLAARCHERAADLFPRPSGVEPTEDEVLEAVGWFPSSKGGAERNWEDEQWEISEVKDDFRNVMGKGSKEWGKWCRLFEKEPEKARKK